MENNTALEEKGAPVKNIVQDDTPTKILDRSSFTHRQYMYLVVGVLVQAFLYSFEVNLMYGCQSNIVAALISSSLISVLPTILQILSAALVPFYTKVSDVVGRAEALTFAMVFYLIGYTIQGTSSTFKQYALGQIAYGIGSTGMLTLTQVLIADTTSLINRGIVFALWDLPSAVNIFATQPLIDPLSGPGRNWRNVYLVVGLLSAVGAVAILTPLWYLQKKVQRKGVKVHRRSLGWLLHEYDAIGALLITLGMSLTLLPMILAKTFEGNWKNGKILGMFISGVIALALLAFWELKYTDKPIMPMRIWMNRTCFGGLVVGFFMTVMASMNWMYFTLYLVVSRNLGFDDAYLLERGYQVAYLVFQLLTAMLMKRYNTYRPFIWIGIVVHTAGIGLMIPARLPTSSDAFVVISQTIVGAAGGMANIASSVAVTGAVGRKDIATVIGVTQIMGSFGSAFGNALAGGVWTQYLPQRLAMHITGPYDEFLAMNSPTVYIPSLDEMTRSQLIEAYSDSQKLMSIIAMSLAVFACACTVPMQYVDLLKDQAPSMDSADSDARLADATEDKPDEKS
ncbi:major facilitator superfamily domain-containing protein [Gamsiella multidivaricata]|uniref:major facilitator superfamily domain-containing protein n=1 Tax=Gamsiella multidivaricata TaxID=101098 RepID=UPI00221FA928|nr:major facilitator superfamily domain-containing protein [Gamsiella multidivaricata]KAG0369248.1 hypothetical protein BGZ54_010468 [Gamsiella multidivaricata]KAI7818225.1 major facilitator superfamily domain-containing protein [Gamsiella multidivaricata]